VNFTRIRNYLKTTNNYFCLNSKIKIQNSNQTPTKSEDRSQIKSNPMAQTTTSSPLDIDPGARIMILDELPESALVDVSRICKQRSARKACKGEPMRSIYSQEEAPREHSHTFAVLSNDTHPPVLPRSDRRVMRIHAAHRFSREDTTTAQVG
jgi:hypothetical protein